LGGVIQGNWRELDDGDQSRLLGLRKDHWALLGRIGLGLSKQIVFHGYREKIQKTVLRTVAANDADFPDVAIEAYKTLLDLDDVGPATATRLLTLARPDRFVSLNGGSREGLAKCFDFQHPTALEKPDNYRSLLERIYDQAWFREPAPQDALEQEISSMRAALLDCFVYEAMGA